MRAPALTKLPATHPAPVAAMRPTMAARALVSSRVSASTVTKYSSRTWRRPSFSARALPGSQQPKSRMTRLGREKSAAARRISAMVPSVEPLSTQRMVTRPSYSC